MYDYAPFSDFINGRESSAGTSTPPVRRQRRQAVAAKGLLVDHWSFEDVFLLLCLFFLLFVTGKWEMSNETPRRRIAANLPQVELMQIVRFFCLPCLRPA